jgi:hypothetical protein
MYDINLFSRLFKPSKAISKNFVRNYHTTDEEFFFIYCFGLVKMVTAFLKDGHTTI